LRIFAPASLRFLAFNDTCFTLPQIEVVLPSGSRWRSFIDPNTNIVVKHAARIDCEISQPVVVHHQNVWQEFDPQKGTFSLLLAQNIQTVSSFSDPSSLPSPPRLTIFHNLFLTNLSELTERDQLHELWLSMDHSRLSKYVSSVLSPHQVSSLSEHPSLELDISRIEISGDTWPPRATTVPMHVLSLGSDHAFFVAQIPVRVNGIRMLALVDTGAGITVASKALMPLLGITHLEATLVPAAVGMAGIPVKFVGRSDVLIQVANQKIHQTLHFTDSQCISSRADSYNIILGNDLLGRLPSWSMDYQKRLFHVGNDYVQILTCAAQESITVPDVTQF
uniref:Peptidase A2 domain-containing protein n=1 Tax=Heligmosomoides polygyrus TaxID=6339 RepID=A0A183FBR4_HELPZ